MSATRLPGKPLLKINNLSIISHVFKKAEKSKIGEVVVATEDQEIFDEVLKNKGNAILTSKSHKTGTDRIYEAYKKLCINDVDFILNLQGDEPIINTADILHLNNFMIKEKLEIGTLGAELKDKSNLNDRNVVKVVTKKKLNFINSSIALKFIRENLSRDIENVYHHIGIYSYSVEALEKFVNYQQTKNEIKNKLEQLRALDNNLDINVGLAKSSPIGVDTHEDYLAIKKIMEYKS